MLDVGELEKLAKILTPEMIRFMELTRDTGAMVMPVKGDTLIFMNDAAKVLHTNSTMISRYVKEGLLRPVYTPHCNKRKFWLSEVKALAKGAAE